MSSVDDLLLCIERFDSAEFLKHYILLLKENYTLGIPKSTKMEDLVVEWAELVPVECLKVPDLFFEELAELWISVKEKYVKYENMTILDSLLKTIDKVDFKHAKSVKDISQGRVHVELSLMYHKVNNLFNTLTAKDLEKYMRDSLKQADERKFLLYYICLLDHQPQLSLPNRFSIEDISRSWKSILTKEFKMNSKDFLAKVSTLYYNILQTFGYLDTAEKKRKCCHVLLEPPKRT